MLQLATITTTIPVLKQVLMSHSNCGVNDRIQISLQCQSWWRANFVLLLFEREIIVKIYCCFLIFRVTEGKAFVTPTVKLHVYLSLFVLL
jgi:hypothetical protein